MTMFKEEGYRLMGAAFEVYNQIGYGMAEEIYQQSLEIELALQGIPFQSKQALSGTGVSPVLRREHGQDARATHRTYSC
jgi:GxxExxY protein